MNYVAGILFNQRRTQCVLIQKRRPDWQAGFYNAVGGKMEGDETPLDAMHREFQEETGLSITNWLPACTIHNVNGAVIFFFKCFMPDGVLMLCRSTTDEQLMAANLNQLFMVRCIPNIRWLVPVMLCDALLPFEVKELTKGGFPAE